MSNAGVDANSYHKELNNAGHGVPLNSVSAAVHECLPHQLQQKNDAGDFSEYVGNNYSYEEAAQKANNLDAEIASYGASSDKLISLMFILVAGNGLAALDYKNWKAYFDSRLGDSSCTESTLYHFAEIAEFSLGNKIMPVSPSLKALRAVCRAKAAIRQKVWEEAQASSGCEVPPVAVIKKIHAKYKNAKDEKVKAVFAKLTTGKSRDELDQIYEHIDKRIEQIENDTYGIQELGVTMLKKLKVSFQPLQLNKS